MARRKNGASLEQIFGSKVRVRLLRLFLEHPDEHFYVREITRSTRSHINSVRRELANLCKVGLIHVYDDSQGGVRVSGLQRKFYEANSSCVIFEELRQLLLKGQLFLQEKFAHEFQQLGPIRYLALTGFLVGEQGFPTDLLVVGRVPKRSCEKLIKDFEDEFGRTLNYTILSPHEFVDRKEMMDRFLYKFFEAKKVVLIDKLPISARMGI